MGKDKLLGLDLNEIANKAIQEKLDNLEDNNNKLSDDILKLSMDNNNLQKSLSKYKAKNAVMLDIFDRIKTTFHSLERIPKTDKEYAKDLPKVRYEYLCKVMELIYGVKTNHSFCHGSLALNLSIAFYKSRPELLTILDIIDIDKDRFTTRTTAVCAKDFVMPYDYSKEKIIEYVKKPQYNTNGCMNGIEALTNYNCIPHDIIQQSPYITDPDVWSELITSVKEKRGCSYMLFDIYRNNKNITIDHIDQLGEFVIRYISKGNTPKEVSNFLSVNLVKFSAPTLEVMYKTFINSENHFSAFHWDKFPIEYQFRYLLSKSFSEVLSITNHYSCKWSAEEKESFYKQYFTKKS